MGMNYLNWKSGKKVENSAIAQDESLAEHDKKYHPEGFDPKKDECKLRETMAAEGKKDDLGGGEKGEEFDAENLNKKIEALRDSEDWKWGDIYCKAYDFEDGTKGVGIEIRPYGNQKADDYWESLKKALGDAVGGKLEDADYDDGVIDHSGHDVLPWTEAFYFTVWQLKEGKKTEGEKKPEEAKLPTVGEFVTLKADGKKYEIVEDLGEGNYWLKSDNPNQNGNGTFGVNAKEHLEGIKYLEQKAAKEKAANDKAVAEFTERRNEIVKSDVYKKIMAATDFSKSPRKAYEQKRIVKNSLPVMNQHVQKEMGRKLGFTYTENGMDFGDQRVIDAIVKMLPANASKKDIERFAEAVQEDVVAACGIEGKYEGPYATDDCIRHALPEDHPVRKLFEDK